MELLIWIFIAFVFMAILGVTVQNIVFLILLLLFLVTAFVTIAFAKTAFSVLHGEKVKGNFLKFDRHPNHNYQTAYYNVNGEAVSGSFPCESVLKDKLYNTEESVSLILVKKKDITVAYDKIQIMTVTIGNFFGSFLSILLIFALNFVK